jgi:hypothetical protein
VYWAEAKFFWIRFVYSGLIFNDTNGFTTEKSTLQKTRKPVIIGTIEFSNKILNIEIILKRTDDAIIRSLYKDGQNNELIWNCHHPKALAEIIYNRKSYKGFGYAEPLFSYIKPWNLPLEELRWGRFLSDSHTVIWINWLGKYPVNKIFFNGLEFNDAIYEDDNIIFGEGTYQLKFTEISFIRKGKLSGLFQKMKLLKLFLNRRISDTEETKKKASTTLTKSSVFLSSGWSLYEVVTWSR